jgi:hypothetical protein
LKEEEKRRKRRREEEEEEEEVEEEKNMIEPTYVYLQYKGQYKSFNRQIPPIRKRYKKKGTQNILRILCSMNVYNKTYKIHNS